MSIVEAANPALEFFRAASTTRGTATRAASACCLQQYRNYLMVLAATQIEKRLQPRVSPSDVVQETMLRAHKNFGQFRGTTEEELLALAAADPGE